MVQGTECIVVLNDRVIFPDGKVVYDNRNTIEELVSFVSVTTMLMIVDTRFK
jgi:hypothetical protein